MSEERAPYITGFNSPAEPGVAEEFRRARKDFTLQVNRAATAEANAARLEARLQELQKAAWEVCRCANEMPLDLDLNDPKQVKITNDFNAALRHLAHLISYPGWYQL